MVQRMQLGHTGMEVTQLGFGAMELRQLAEDGGRLPNEEQAGRVLNAVLDGGVNFVDTSWCYGRSEEFIGRYISHRRDEYFLATKCGHYWRRDSERSGYSREGIMNCINESLTRLHTDHVDLLQLHNPRPDEVRRQDSVAVLQDLKAQGKIRAMGVSTSLPHVDEFLEMGVFETFQIPYSALEPEHDEVLRRVAEAGAGVIIRGGVAKGSPVAEAGDSRTFARTRPRWDKSQLGALAPDIDPMELILRFTLSHPAANTVIVGTQSLEHMSANMEAAAKGPLDPALVEEIRSRTAALD